MIRRVLCMRDELCKMKCDVGYFCFMKEVVGKRGCRCGDGNNRRKRGIGVRIVNRRSE